MNDTAIKFVIKAIGVFLVFVGLWFGLALLFAGESLLKEEGLPMLVTVIVYCVGGVFSGFELHRCKRRGRVLASWLLVWALVFTTYFACFHSRAGHVSILSVVVILAVVAGLLTLLQSPGARRVCNA